MPLHFRRGRRELPYTNGPILTTTPEARDPAPSDGPTLAICQECGWMAGPLDGLRDALNLANAHRHGEAGRGHHCTWVHWGAEARRILALPWFAPGATR